MEDEKLICFTKDELLKPREIVIEIMDYMVRAGLTDYTGGNMALRVGKKIYSTQTKASIDYRWKLHPDDIMVTDIDQNVLEGRMEKLSSEADLHHGILKRFPQINCTLHGNTHYSPLIISRGIEARGVTEVAADFNIKKIAVVPKEYPMFSEEEKNYIYDAFSEMESRGEAMTVIMHDHGSMVAAKDHNKAFVLFNALEANSKYIFNRELLNSSKLVSEVFEKINSSLDDVRESKDYRSKEIKAPGKISDILTGEDVENIKNSTSSKKIFIGKECKVTSIAESKAQELRLEIVREK